MPEAIAHFQDALLPGETLDLVVDNLSLDHGYVPTMGVLLDHRCGLSGAMGLTNKRLIILYIDVTYIKRFSTSTIYSLTERPWSNQKPKWPYQALLIVGGGYTWVVQTEKPDIEHGKNLCLLVNQAFQRFCPRSEDPAIMAAIIAHEEGERKRRQDD